MAQAPVEVDFGGKWERIKAEGLDDFLKSEGVGMLLRKAASKLSVTHEIDQQGDIIKISVTNPKGTTIEELKLDGTEILSKNDNGDDVKTIAKWEDDNKTTILIDTQNITQNRKSNGKRYINKNNEMVFEMTNDKGKTVKNIFKKV